MLLSIIIPVLNSHEILRRQMIYMESIGIPSDTEIIIVDDGSDPALEYAGKLPMRIIQTNDTRPWTWALARNRGAREAKGEYLLMIDLDFIITKKLLDFVRGFTGQKIQFKREFAVLDKNGEFTQDLDVLMSYGFPKERLKNRGLRISPHPNDFVMRRDIFFKLGGYREDIVGRSYPQGEDRMFKKAWCIWESEGKGKVHHERPTIYMFPSGKYCGDVDQNPFGLFHKLSRKTKRNYWYRKQRGA